jgi:hypothetical protein
VLAGINEQAAAGVRKRTGPAAEAIARFEERDFQPSPRQRGRSRKARQPASDYDDTLGHSVALDQSTPGA